MISQSLEPFLPNKHQVRQSFDRVATRYDEGAVLQQVVGARLLDRLSEVRLAPDRVLDAGAGTGRGTVALAERYPQARVIAVDSAPSMLRQARRRAVGWQGWRSGVERLLRLIRRNPREGFVCADVDALPFAPDSIDLIHSNLTLQWCPDLDRTFQEWGRILRSDGLLVFTTFGPDTLRELRNAWRTVDDYSHVNAFLDMHDIGDTLTRAGFCGIVMDVEHMTLTYGDLAGLMRDLKGIGAHNVTQGRLRGLTGRGRLHQLTNAYEKFRQEGRLPATYEIIYGHAWFPATRSLRSPQAVTIPVGQIRRPGDVP